MEPTRTIEYQGVTYPVFSLEITCDNETEKVDVSVESLESELLPDTLWKNKEAEKIDESIFFYIPDSLANGGEYEIRKHIEEDL